MCRRRGLWRGRGRSGWRRSWQWRRGRGVRGSGSGWRTRGVLGYRAPGVAAELLRRALAQLPDEDPRREVLEAGLVRVAFLRVRDEEVERAARPLLARTADPDRAAEAAWLLAYTLARTGRLGESAAVVEAGLARPGTGRSRIACSGRGR
jgi:hypothetical protein